ncbi:MAG: short-chain dehydrogenase [Alphaproteobacteria bacterium RIFCSPHIGHO2_12_FULL_63_12]|nr:MAG: short-chain dehydrogenase [Alphaproteobacteria bacterium RIFCSPHIGHO2_12_FULL_63_12]
MNFQNKTALVTGASSGIGEALVKGLAARGARVILSGRRVDELTRVAKAAGGETLVLPFEATVYDALPDVVAKAMAWKGGVDLLINNAGISQRSLALDTSFDVYRTIMEIDFFAPVRLTQLVLPSMVERKSGHIVIISSVAGKVGAPLRTAYCAAKHACVGYYDALRAEIETAYGIGVSVVTPGSVRTAIASNAMTGDGSARGRSDDNIDNGMAPERAAEIILDGVANGVREIPVAEGMELAALQMRAANPDALFGFVAQEGARLAAAREAGEAIDPAAVNR